MIRRRMMAGAAATVAAVVLTACGSSSSSSSSAGGAGVSASSSSGATGPVPSTAHPQTVTLSFVPVSDADGTYAAINHGFFKQHGINVKINKSTSGGPQIIPELLSNHVQFGYIGVTDLAIAVSKGFKLAGMGPYDVGASSAGQPDAASFVWLKKSGITSAAGLAGKTVAINSLNGLGQMLVDAAVKKSGGNPKSVKFVAINFPDMNTALNKGEVDAAWEVEPFTTIEQEQESGVVRTSSSYPMEPDAPISEWAVSKSYLASHGAIVKAVQAALNEGNTYAEAHPSEDRSVIEKLTDTPAKLGSKMALQGHATSLPAKSIAVEVTAMQQAGLLTKTPAISTWWLGDPIK